MIQGLYLTKFTRFSAGPKLLFVSCQYPSRSQHISSRRTGKHQAVFEPLVVKTCSNVETEGEIQYLYQNNVKYANLSNTVGRVKLKRSVSQYSSAEHYMVQLLSGSKLWGYMSFMGSPITGNVTRSPFYKHGLTLIPVWISNYIHHKMWGEIIYPFLSFNGASVEV